MPCYAGLGETLLFHLLFPNKLHKASILERSLLSFRSCASMRSVLTRPLPTPCPAGLCTRPPSSVHVVKGAHLQGKRKFPRGPALRIQGRNFRWPSIAIRASLRDAEEMVRSGEVQLVSPKDAQPLLSVENNPYKLLDVRPMWEWEKAYVDGSFHVPLFIEDSDTSAMTLLRKWIQLGFGGMWLGQRLTARNEQFVQQVEDALPRKEERLLVACGEGLRSLLAIEELQNAGYTQLAWVAGGFNNVRDGDFARVEGSTKLQWATVGGMSEYFLKLTLLLTGLVSSVLGAVLPKDN